ncbi:CapA family protein [Terribacillus saccharophilus]|uniref:Capsule biosynthesis protein n=1 Tax=Terribacillus saccharophilus TaxID=361277 RepID=A0A268AB63_9BACI|nr:CapA family protein [Terribacillus saccharophilus]PAD21299.1 capsule biosynthesis protein [Terribacillus saccharophilus]
MDNKKNTISFVASGDSFITRRLPSYESEFQQLSNLIKKADVRFTNLEVTTHNFEGFPSALSGGTWAIASPDVLKDLKSYGFNMLAWANNHTLDYSYGGLDATYKYLNQNEIVHAGVGYNLAEASQPKYLETPYGRVAIIAATSTYHEYMAAGEQRPDISGRPGINPLDYSIIHVLSKEKLNQLNAIEKAANVNGFYEQGVKEGILNKVNGDFQPFSRLLFKEGEKEGKYSKPNSRDLKRILGRISEAKRQADYVLISIHSHEIGGNSLDEPADFLKIFSRACIDEGAHAVIGHGPHVIRGIEIYKKRPIFYSLGNFIFQNETVSHLPSDYYEKVGLDNNHNVADAFDKSTKNGTKGFSSYPLAWESILPFWTMEGDNLKEITLYPLDLGFGLSRQKRGWPTLRKNEELLKRLASLSSKFGTTIEIEDGIGKISF